MTDLDSALIEAASVLEECSISFMPIGGLAVAAWGEARSTLDLDFCVWRNYPVGWFSSLVFDR